MARKKKTKKKSDKAGNLINVDIADNSCKTSRPQCSGTYGLGILGAAVYFISTATGFWNGVWGILKALVWPASLIFEVLKYIGA